MNTALIPITSTHYDSINEELPQMIPMDRVLEFESEVDAINYSVDQIIRERRGLNHMQLADDMKIARAVLTKMRQGQVAVPTSKFLTFIHTTKSYALLQFYALQLGLTIRTKEQDRAEAQKIADLEQENAELRGEHLRVFGRE